MPEYLPIAVRAYAKPLTAGGTPRTARRRRRSSVSWTESWPRTVLVIDTETRTDLSQRLMVGFYRVEVDGRTRETGTIEPDDPTELNHRERLVLDAWCEQHPAIVRRTRANFMGEVFYPFADRGHAVVVGFNLPFDLSRLAIRATPTRAKDGFSFTFVNKIDTRGRNSAPRWAPRVRILPIDSHRAMIQFTGRKEPGRFLDLATLAFALTGKRQSLESACKLFGTELAKGEHPPFGTVSTKLLDYALRDVEATAQLYERLVADYALHPITTPPHQVYSPASIGKAYYAAIGLELPTLVSRVDLKPEQIHGLATHTYFGGRTECRIRRTIVPVIYADFLSMYPTVNTLMGLWRTLTARRIEVRDATEETRQFVDTITPDDLFNPKTWTRLMVLVEIEPERDPLPARARFGSDTYTNHTIAITPLTSTQPLWYTLADIITAKLKSGKTPRIRRALCLTPRGTQRLQPVRLRGQVEIDSKTHDFFREVIRKRRAVKHDTSLDEAERNALQYFLKILANSTSYGIFMEMNRKEGVTAQVRVYTETPFDTTVDNPEELGRYCYPPLASFITSGARLMLALAERLVRAAGGQYAFMDTDSLAIVATENGGLIPCPNGPEQLPNGTQAIRALGWVDVEAIRERFRTLNPYGTDDSVLELESENLDPVTNEPRQLYAYSIASKRYALFNRDGETIQLRKYSEHVLGGYDTPCNPDTGERETDWIAHTWTYLIRRASGLPASLPVWAATPVTSQLSISKPRMHAWFNRWNKTTRGRRKPYAGSVKPFNFLTHPVVDPLSAASVRTERGPVSLIAPFGERREFVNRHDPSGPVFRVGEDFTPRTYADLIRAYDRHPERKFAGRDGKACVPATIGLLSDLPLVATWVRLVGKEANEIEQIDAGVMETEAERMLMYDDGEWEAIQRVLKMVPTKDLQRMTGYSRSMVKYVKTGERRPRFDDRPRIASIASTYARERLVTLGYDCSADDWEALSRYGAYVRRQEAQDEQARDARTVHRERKHDLIAAVRGITNRKGIAPTRDIVTEWSVHVPSTLRRRSGVPADDVASSVASDYPQFGVLDEASLFDLFDELWEG